MKHARLSTTNSHITVRDGNGGIPIMMSMGAPPFQAPSTTQNIIFSVTHYLELRNAIIVYCASHFSPTMIELVDWTLYNMNILT